VKVKIGDTDIDVLSVHEARGIVRSELRRPVTELVRAEESGKTDGGGNLVLPIYVVPAAMEFRAHWLMVEADGFTFAAPFNGAGAFWRMRVAARGEDGASLVAAAANGTALPFTRSYGFMQGPVSLNQEAIELELNAGPVNTLIRAFLRGTLVPHPGRPAEQ
jgi:hypothetical protein